MLRVPALAWLGSWRIAASWPIRRAGRWSRSTWTTTYSGKQRPAYEWMLADLRDGERDAVNMYHVDRLTRRPDRA
jgi:DNA invertase Pin-like site-specific DNA recombinase